MEALSPVNIYSCYKRAFEVGLTEVVLENY